MKRALALVAAPAALAISLAACGDNKDSGDSKSGGSMAGHSMSMSASPSTGAQAGQHNGQDVMFAQMMIPHHRQAIEMADLAATRASSPQVKSLAADIEKEQTPEIERLSGWLTGWGSSVPSPGMGGMDRGGMDGLMTEKDMKELEAAKGAAFDKAFLQMMIKHHEGAVAMAMTEQSAGQFPDAKTMAAGIISSQSTEITKMRTLLKKQ
ncbi:hypothetical protein amrb99_15020 [Actinomadura sp. RB99]|uniref:DUF305 domain-containing protein n=1 Tax=Actinomadura sp. RB99 TaxID=2691577 RepID=UPI0016890514|nr:DUF305 domain-containing protein [Actinomadura sp. RB99]MBD2892592.1 hypothetical protein [Actinomadura sp. RB99]